MTGTDDGRPDEPGTPGNDGDHGSIVLRLVDEVDHERAASILRHENDYLRARLRGRDRADTDPATEASLARATKRVGELEGRVSDLTGQRDQLATRIQRLETEVRAGQLLADRLTSFERRLVGQAETIERFEELRLTERDEHTARQSEWIADLEGRLDRAETARDDLRLLLGRIATSPLRFLFRRRPGYRAMEDRWT